MNVQPVMPSYKAQNSTPAFGISVNRIPDMKVGSLEKQLKKLQSTPVWQDVVNSTKICGYLDTIKVNNTDHLLATFAPPNSAADVVETAPSKVIVFFHDSVTMLNNTLDRARHIFGQWQKGIEIETARKEAAQATKQFVG